MALPRRMMNSRRRMEPTPTLSREANVACREHYQTSPQMACYGNPASTPRLRARACTHPFVAGITAAVIGVDTAFHSLAFSPTGRRRSRLFQNFVHDISTLQSAQLQPNRQAAY